MLLALTCGTEVDSERIALGGWVGQAIFQWLPRGHLCLLLPDFRAESIIFFDVSVLQALAQSTSLHTHQITESAVMLSFTTSQSSVTLDDSGPQFPPLENGDNNDIYSIRLL